MKKYAKIENEETKQVSVGLGTNTKFYQSIGMTEMNVEQDYRGNWYVEGYAPIAPTPTHEDQRLKRAAAYQVEVDPITCHILRLQDDVITPEVEQEITDLKIERAEVVEQIKARYPYPEEESES